MSIRRGRIFGTAGEIGLTDRPSVSLQHLTWYFERSEGWLYGGGPSFAGGSGEGSLRAGGSGEGPLRAGGGTDGLNL